MRLRGRQVGAVLLLALLLAGCALVDEQTATPQIEDPTPDDAAARATAQAAASELSITLSQAILVNATTIHIEGYTNNPGVTTMRVSLFADGEDFSDWIQPEDRTFEVTGGTISQRLNKAASVPRVAPSASLFVWVTAEVHGTQIEDSIALTIPAPFQSAFYEAPTVTPTGEAAAVESEESEELTATPYEGANHEEPTTIAGGQIELRPEEDPWEDDSPFRREQLIQKYLDQLDPGLIIYNPPTEMTAGQNYLVQARITRELTDTAVLTSTESAVPAARAFTGDLVGPGEPRIDTLQVGTYMSVRLDGENFRIEPLSEKRQVVGRSGFNEWAWNVTPTWHGEHPLRLVATIHIEVAGSKDVREWPAKTEVIRVNVDPVYTASEIGRAYWQIILGLAALAIVIPAVLFRRRRSHRSAALVAPGETREALERQLATARENLSLIRERKSDYVLDTDIPLDLIKNERALEAEIAALEAALAAAPADE